MGKSPKIRKKWLTFAPLIVLAVIYNEYLNQNLSLFLFSVYYFSMLIYWRKEIVQKLKKTWELRRKIRQHEYFNITELRYKTDIKKRREVSYVFLIAAYGVLFVLESLFRLFNYFRIDIYNISFSKIIVIVILSLVFIAIVLWARYYWTSFYYYVIPLFSFTFLSGGFDDIGSVSNILKYFVGVLIIYTFFTILLPIPYLRKVTRTIFVFGAVFSILIPTFTEHILSSYMINKFPYHNLTMGKVSSLALPKQISAMLNNQEILEIVNDVAKEIYPLMINHHLASISTLGFLTLSGYTLGSLVINAKIKLGDLRAKQIYDSLQTSHSVNYFYLRDIIYYGGEAYQNRILDNLCYREIIFDHESSIEFVKIEHSWFISVIISIFNWGLEKLKSCI